MSLHDSPLAFLVGIAISLYVSYLIIRAAVRSGTTWALRDILEDRALRRQLIDLVDPARADAE